METQRNHNSSDEELKKYWKKITSLKPQFDKIRAKSYRDAFKFWDEKVIPLAVNHPLKPMSIPLPITFYLSINESSKHRAGKMELKERPEDILTIAPADNDDEKAIFNEWYLGKHENEYEYNFELRRQIFAQTIKKFKSLKSQKEFIEREIDKVNPPKINTNPNPNYPVHPNALKSAVELQKKLDALSGIDNYRDKRILPDLGKMGADTALTFARLKCNVDFKEYLEQQLEKLEGKDQTVRTSPEVKEKEMIVMIEERFGKGIEHSDESAKAELNIIPLLNEKMLTNRQECFNYLKRIKPLFDKLNYPDKLEIWRSKGFYLIDLENIPLSDGLSLEYEDNSYINNMPFRVYKETNFLSISPENHKGELYYDWLLPYFKDEANLQSGLPLDFDLLVDKYFNHIEKNPLARKKYTELEIKSNRAWIDYEEENRTNNIEEKINSGSLVSAFCQGYNHYVQGDWGDFPSVELKPPNSYWDWYVQFQRGVIHAQYEGFLDEQLAKLNRGEDPLKERRVNIVLSENELLGKIESEVIAKAEEERKKDVITHIDNNYIYIKSLQSYKQKIEKDRLLLTHQVYLETLHKDENKYRLRVEYYINWSRRYTGWEGRPYPRVEDDGEFEIFKEIHNYILSLIKKAPRYARDSPYYNFDPEDLPTFIQSNIGNAEAIELRELDSIPDLQAPKVNALKPNFSAEAIPKIFNILKVYFPLEQHKALEEILKTGDNSDKKLLFGFSGAALCDYFKQLYQGQFLAIGVQAQLEKWIAGNFFYTDKKGKAATLTPKYASRSISENNRPAKGNRLIDIKKMNDGSFEIIQLQLKNRQQNKNMEEKSK